MRNLIKFLITLLVGVSLFYFIVKETGVEAIWTAVSFFFGWEGVAILTVTILSVLTGALRWREILRSEGEEVPLFLTIRYLIKGFTVDFLTPFALFGGEAVRIFLMEERVGIKKSAFSSITDKIMDVTAHFLFLVLGMIFFVLYGTYTQDIFFLYAGAVVMVIFLVLALFYGSVLRKKSFLGLISNSFKLLRRYFVKTENGKTITEVEEKIIFFFSSKKKEFAKGMFLSLLRHLLLLTRVFLIIIFVTGEIDLNISIAVYGLAILSMILPLPAALGGMDAILGFGFGVLGFGLASGVTSAVALRGADLVLCLFGIILFIRLSFKVFYHQFNAFLKRFK